MAKSCYLLVLILMMGSLGRVSAEERLVFGVTPWMNASELFEMHAPLMQYLEDELGVNVVLVISDNYQDLQTKLVNRQVDVGMFSSGAYVKAVKDLPALNYLASVKKDNVHGQAKSYYRGVILTLKQSQKHTLDDLQGLRFGFTDKSSSSGYIFPAKLLMMNQIVPEQFFSKVFYLGKHENIIKALVAGSIDAGATYEDMIDEAINDFGDIFEPIAYTPEIPFDAYAAGPHIKIDVIKALQAALARYQRPINLGHAVDIGPSGFGIFSDQYYDFLRASLE